MEIGIFLRNPPRELLFLSLLWLTSLAGLYVQTNVCVNLEILCLGKGGGMISTAPPPSALLPAADRGQTVGKIDRRGPFAGGET
jgi:hypothetical protein